MALPPVVPSDTAAIVPQPGDPACTILSSMVQMIKQWNAYIGWKINEDGSATQDYIDWTGVGGTNALAAPTGVSASENRTADVTITWNEVSDASYYVVYRGTVGDTSTMTVLSGNLTERSYVDTTPTADVTYWYSVRAYSSSRVSALSTPDRGIKLGSVAPTTLTKSFTWNKDTPLQYFTVPADQTYVTMEAWIWGSGGTGGRFEMPAPVTGEQLAAAKAGGGGGSGSFVRITGVPIASGDVLYFRIGKATSPSEDGSTTLWKDAELSSEYAYATGGGPGGNSTAMRAGDAGGLPAVYGVNNFGGGSVTEADSTLGNAGTAGSGVTPGTGGAGRTYGGVTAGAGGNGALTSSTVPPGGEGYIRLIFRT